MAKTDFRSVEEYTDALAEGDRALVNEVLDAIRSAVPDAEETISYQLPAFKDHGWIFYVGVAKKHVSLSCPPPFTVFEEFGAELAGYGMSKSTIRFPKDEPMPTDLIARMAAFRSQENRARA